MWSGVDGWNVGTKGTICLCPSAKHILAGNTLDGGDNKTVENWIKGRFGAKKAQIPSILRLAHYKVHNRMGSGGEEATA